MRPVSAAAIASLASLSLPASAQTDLSAVLSRARGSSGHAHFAQKGAALVLQGRAFFMGNEGTFRMVVDSMGRVLRSIDARLPDAFGETGEAGWAVDWNGVPRRLGAKERHWNQLFAAVVSGAWAAEGSPLRVATHENGDGPENTVALELTHRDGLLEATLFVTRDTGLPARLLHTGLAGEERWTFGDYRESDGVRIPGTITHTVGEVVNRLEVESVRFDASVTPERFAMPQGRASAVRFDTVHPGAIQLKRGQTGHLFLKPLVNGKEVGWFFFDTGAGGTVISKQLAAELELPVLGESNLVSIHGPEKARILEARSLSVGPVTLVHPKIVEMDMEWVTSALGFPVVGIMGFDLLSRCVAQIDPAADVLTLFAPERFDDQGLRWHPLHLSDRHPVVEARFEGGHSGLFKMDVGASGGPFGNVTFHAPAVARLNLLEGRQVEPMNVGVSEVAIGELAWFELAGHRFEKPRVVFAKEGGGPFSDRYTLGNIGVDFLKPFRIVWDYRNGRVAFVVRETQ